VSDTLTMLAYLVADKHVELGIIDPPVHIILRMMSVDVDEAGLHYERRHHFPQPLVSGIEGQ